MSTTRRLACLAVLAALLEVPGSARAHDVTVDGAATEWLTRSTAANSAIVARTSSSTGELIWIDPSGDTRTDLSTGPELVADLQRVAVTGSATGLHFLLALGPVPPSGDPVQVQIAIDLDRTSESGQRFFGGFADTTVAAAAQWEYLVQTQRTGGALSARVLDTAFADVPSAGATIAQSATGTMEISVPWSALGLSAAPRALRLTVATFREDVATGLTRAIGDGTISNALDAVTNYGGPGDTGNTWNEVMDGDVDHFLEVWLDASGEVLSPLLVAAFVSNTSASEWIAIHNRSGVGLSLEGVKVGDEETIDGSGEGMYAFPAGAMIAAGQTIVVAQRADTFLTAFGALPEYELTAGDVAVPDLATYAPWFSATPGSFALGNAGDEILVVDARETILDVVTYGNGTFAGVTALTPTPGAGQVAIRTPLARDTDDNDVDFATPAPACDRADATACGECDECTALFVCAPQAAGASCADADACDGAETCDGAGACVAGTPLTCDDGNVCTADRCDASAGCVADPAPGTPCGDGDLCNGAEVCDDTGGCAAGAPVACIDDGDPCTIEMCTPASGTCATMAAAPGTSCADADVCDGDETCDASGACVDGTPPTCDDGNECTADACDALAGCTSTPVGAGAACDDGDACTAADACDGAGACTGTIDPVCVDAGVELDAGTTEDAGVEMDAGIVLDDAGTGEDAGTDDGGLDVDAAPGTDAGARDAGRRDAGADAGEVDGGSSDGCSCRAAGAGGTSGSGALTLLLALGAAIAVRRRRRG